MDEVRGAGEPPSERCGSARIPAPNPEAEPPVWTDTLVDVGAHRLHLRVRPGTAPVTVLFEAGGGADLDSWGPVPETLARTTSLNLVTYDRAGLGASELGPPDLMPTDEVRDIRSALSELGLPPATIVVAHSYGGMLALAHALDFPDAVVGLVLVDPMNPRFVEEFGGWLRTTIPDVSDPETDRDRVIQRMTRTLDAFSARLLTEEPGIRTPMVILSAGVDWWGPDDVEAGWRRSHEEMTAVARNRRRVVAARSAHDIPSTDPGLVVSAVLDLLTEASIPRSGP